MTRQPLGPLLKVKLLVRYIQNPTKLKKAKGIRDLLGCAKNEIYSPQNWRL